MERKRIVGIEMATNPIGNRDNRRRKIVDRGADRLALVTGQIRDGIPPSEPEPDILSSPPSDSFQIQTAVSPDKADDGLRGHEPTAVVAAAPRAGGIVEAPVREVDESIEAPTAAFPESDGIGSSLLSSLPASKDPRSDVPASRAEQQVERQARRKIRVTGKEIISAVAETERYRLFCTLAMAVLVVLSNWGFPLIGCNLIGGIISLKPLYLVSLANLTIVSVQLLLDDQRGSETASRAEPRMPSTGEGLRKQVGLSR